MVKTFTFLLLLALHSDLPPSSGAFSTSKPSLQRSSAVTKPPAFIDRSKKNIHPPAISTQLHYGKFIDVPDGFFTLLFPLLSITLSISKQIARARLEERAWEIRLEESRKARMEADPSLTMSELKRQDAGRDYTAYGRGRQLQVLEKTTTATASKKTGKMTLEDVLQFEADYGIDYDPYYDDPYTEEELPVDETFRNDKVYGDRVYESGEVFYYDKESNLYYRQGSKPRVKNFWS